MSLTKISLLVLLLAVFGTSLGEVVFRSPRKCGKGWSYNAPRSRATVKSVQECKDICGKMDTCQSFQVKTGKGRCQLLRTTAGAWARKMTPRIGWSYREKYDANSDTCSKFPYRTCSPIVRSFSNQDQEVHSNPYSSFQRDSILNDGKKYWIPNYGNERWLYEYSDEAAFRADTRTSYYLPFGCHGAQPIIRNRHLWCKEYNNRKVVIYNIDTNTIVHRISFDSVIDEGGTNYNAGYSDQCHYDWGGQSDIDVMNDYGGVVTIVWGRHNYNCYLAASEIDPDTYEIMDTHWLGIDKKMFGTGFQICGRLYFTEHVHGDPAGHFQLRWDLRTGNFTHLYHNNEHMASYQRFPSRHNYMAMADFNPLDERIYKWQNSRFVSLQVNFEPQPADLFAGTYPGYQLYMDGKSSPFAATVP